MTCTKRMDQFDAVGGCVCDKCWEKRFKPGISEKIRAIFQRKPIIAVLPTAIVVRR